MTVIGTKGVSQVAISVVGGGSSVTLPTTATATDLSNPSGTTNPRTMSPADIASISQTAVSGVAAYDGYIVVPASIVDANAPSISSKYVVTANGQNVPVYTMKYASSYGYVSGVDPSSDTLGFCRLDASGKVRLEITVNTTVSSAIVLPSRKRITPKLNGNFKVQFTGDGPTDTEHGFYEVQINSAESQPLFIALKPIKTYPTSSGGGITVYPSGYTSAGSVTINAGETYVIPADACVKALFTINGTGASLIGRGFLTGAAYSAQSHTFITCYRASKIEGITLVDAPGFGVSLWKASNVEVNDIDNFSWRNNSDGIDFYSLANSRVKRALLRNRDDAITGKCTPGDNIDVDSFLAEDCYIANDSGGRAIGIGAETVADNMSNITFRRIDIVHSHASNAISIEGAGHSTISGVLFEDIYIEGHHGQTSGYSGDGKWISFLTIYSTAWSGSELRGKIDGVTLRRVHFDDGHYGSPLPSEMVGASALSGINNISFEDCFVNGLQLSDTAQLSLTANPYVYNVNAYVAAQLPVQASVATSVDVSGLVSFYAVSPFVTVKGITQVGEVTFRRNSAQVPSNTVVITTPENIAAFRTQYVTSTAVGTAGTNVAISTVKNTARSFVIYSGNRPHSAGFSNVQTSAFNAQNLQAMAIYLKSLSTVAFSRHGSHDTATEPTAATFGGCMVIEYLGASGDPHEIQNLCANTKGFELLVTAATTIKTTVLSMFPLFKSKVVPFIGGNNSGTGAVRQIIMAQMSGNTVNVRSGAAGATVPVAAFVTPVEFRGSAWSIANMSYEVLGNGVAASANIAITSGNIVGSNTVDVDWNHTIIYSQFMVQSSILAASLQDRAKSVYPLVLPHTSSTVSVIFSTGAVCSGATVISYLISNSAMNVVRVVNSAQAAGQVEINLSANAVNSAGESLLMMHAITSLLDTPHGCYSLTMKSNSTVAMYSSIGNDANDLKVIQVVSLPRDS